MKTPAWLVLLAIIGPACATTGDKHAATPEGSETDSARRDGASAVERIQQEAADLEPFVDSRLARRFLATADDLPAITPRTLYRDPQGRYYKSAEIEDMAAAERTALTEVTADENVYYTTRYGSPMTYSRPLDVLADAGFTSMHRRKVLDFGYGYIGHLRLWAMMGADVTGVEVDELLKVLYSEPQDQGKIRGSGWRSGHLRLIHGQYPADAAVTAAVGDGYDLIISKNVLKNGYIHPEHAVNPRMLVHLGVDDATFVRAIHEALDDGGYFLIYNICPAPNPPDQPYIPWADGRSPFSREMFEAAGLEVLAFNHDDSAAIREMARILGWDRGERAMDLENNLFAEYTLVRKR